MEQKPYTLCSTDGTGRRYRVLRRDDSWARYIFQNVAGLWEIEDERFPPAIPAFPTKDEAALFAYMEGRFYFETARAKPKDIQIRVSPNFGQCNCPSGQWVASLHHEDGRPAGRNSWSASLAEAKALGLRQALLDTNVTVEEANELKWLEAMLH
jgi:hypothetical protein